MFVLKCDMCNHEISTHWDPYIGDEGNCMKLEWEMLRYAGGTDFFHSSDYSSGSIYVCKSCSKHVLEFFSYTHKTESF